MLLSFLFLFKLFNYDKLCHSMKNNFIKLCLISLTGWVFSISLFVFFLCIVNITLITEIIYIYIYIFEEKPLTAIVFEL